MISFLKRIFKFKEPIVKEPIVKEPIVSLQKYTKAYTSGNKLNFNINIPGIKKWYPDDNLVKEYYKITKDISNLKSLKFKKKECIIKLDNLNNTIEYIKNRNLVVNKNDDLNVSDVFEIIELQKDIYDYEIKLKKIENTIENATDINNIMGKYNDYLKSASDFIKNNNLQMFFTTSDILDSIYLFTTIKRILESCYMDYDTDNGVKCMTSLATYFDISSISFNARGQYLIKYEKMYNNLQIIKEIEEIEEIKEIKEITNV